MIQTWFARTFAVVALFALSSAGSRPDAAQITSQADPWFQCIEAGSTRCQMQAETCFLIRGRTEADQQRCRLEREACAAAGRNACTRPGSPVIGTPSVPSPSPSRPGTTAGTPPRMTPIPPPPAPAGGGPFVTEARSGDRPSGERDQYSEWYELCSQPIPASYRIVEANFELRGDRSCTTGWAECRQSVKTDSRVCYQFRMQGHSEDVIAGCLEKPGRHNCGSRNSEGVLRVRAERATQETPAFRPAPQTYAAPQRTRGAAAPAVATYDLVADNRCEDEVELWIRWYPVGASTYTTGKVRVPALTSEPLLLGAEGIKTDRSYIYWYGRGAEQSWTGDSPEEDALLAVRTAGSIVLEQLMRRQTLSRSRETVIALECDE